MRFINERMRNADWEIPESPCKSMCNPDQKIECEVNECACLAFSGVNDSYTSSAKGSYPSELIGKFQDRLCGNCDDWGRDCHLDCNKRRA